MMIRRELTRVHWGPVIAGAFLTVAISIVLGLFGLAFGRGGLRVLGGIWEVLTPLVAAFVGAAVASAIVGRTGAFLNGVMVWCVALAYGALLAIGIGALGTTSRAAPTVTAGGPALAGLAAILGLLGAVAGGAFGAAREGTRPAERRVTPGDVGTRTVYESGQRHEASRIPPTGEPPEMRH